MDCDAVRENIDEWALGALPADESRSIDAHLLTCDACRDAARSATETAASLALAVPMRSASATLKSRVVASAAVLTDIGHARRSRLWPAAVAALVALGIGAMSWGAITQVRVNDLEDRNAAISAGATAQSEDFGQTLATQAQLSQTIETQDAVLEIVMQPDVQRTELVGTANAPAASGRCVWSRALSSGALIVGGLPAAPEGSVYTMWIVYEREWLDAGRFTVDDDGQGRLLMTRWGRGDNDDAGAFGGFAVTVAPASDAPSIRGETVMVSAGTD
jgi:hypothetical protein